MKTNVVHYQTHACNHGSGHSSAHVHYYDGTNGDMVYGHNFPPQAETNWLANKTTFMLGAAGGW